MRSLMFGFTTGCLFMFLVIFSVTVPKFINATSIEYTEKCKCGGVKECYESFADGYIQKECKECGDYYVKEVK